MSDSKKPPRPFLDEGELVSELDAWDATFDALHVPEEPAESAAPLPAEPVMDWPAPSPEAERSAKARVPEPALTAPELSHTLDDLDAQMTLDNAIENEPAPSASSPAWEIAENETDFSDVGTEGEPAALAEMLGSSSGSLPRVDSEPETELLEIESSFDDDDDGVYTSASRPGFVSPPIGRALTDDPLAPPPKPAPAVRRTAAIIRRTPESIPVPRVTPSAGYPITGDSSFGPEVTKIADPGEIEARALQSRGHDRSKAPTAPPPLSFTPSFEPEPAEPEPDEYEIEIGAESAEPSASESVSPVPVAPRRTVAHVVRRTEAFKVPAVAPERPASEPKIEVDVPVAPAAEDDFSDVAAAVGADEDPSFVPPVPRRRPSTPGRLVPQELGIPVAPHEVGAYEEEEAENAAIDDHMSTIALEDESVLDERAEDAYVPLTPQLDDALEIPAELPPIDDGEYEPQTRLLPTSGMDDAPRTTVSERPPALVDLYPRVKTPTSVPPLGELPDASTGPRPKLRAATPLPVLPGDEAHDIEPTIDLEAIQLPEQVQPLPTAELDDEAAAALLVYEREIATVDDSSASATLRVEAGRLCERLGDLDRARAHYDAALLADPRETTALRGLRRIARGSSDLVEATRQLDAELAVAGALERRPLGHYRTDLLLAVGEH
ncbi:MAG: hypothetical protein ACM31C_31660, partial [Acidobacteriota bacterium]